MQPLDDTMGSDTTEKAGNSQTKKIHSLSSLLDDQNLFGLITQHLTFKEVVKTTLVSKQINAVIGRSQFFQSKVQLRITDLKDVAAHHQRRDRLAEVMQKSVRVYKNFHIKADSIANDEIGLLMDQEWDSAIVSINKFETSSSFVKYLGLLTPVLTTLQLSISFIENVDNDVKISAPNLESLVLTGCSSAALQPFVTSSKNNTLKRLTLTAVRQSSRGLLLSHIYDGLIASFEGLQLLDIGSSVASIMFLNDISGVAAFYLKELRIDAPSTTDETTEVCKNIEKFIESQGSSLVEVCLLSWDRPDTLFKIWDAMVKIDVWQMRSNTFRLAFTQPKVALKPSRLKMLYLRYPNCKLSSGYIKPFLDGNQLERIDIQFSLYDEGIRESLVKAVSTVTINGVSLIDDDSSDDADDSDCYFADDQSAVESSIEMRDVTPMEIPLVEVSDSD